MYTIRIGRSYSSIKNSTRRFLDQADFVDGAFGLAFPLTFTPRYIPPTLLHSASSESELPRT